MKKIITHALVLALMLPFGASAAVDKAFVYSLNPGPNAINYGVDFYDNTTSIRSDGGSVSLSGITTLAQLEPLINASVNTIASGQGYTLSNGIIWDSLAPSQVSALIASATSSLTLPQAMSFANPSRSLNSAFQVSSTRASYVNYSVDIATVASIAGGQVGTVYLEYADDSGFTTNVKEVGRFVNGQTGTLVVGLTLNQTNTAQVQGIVPAGKYVRLRTANNTGTPTFTFRSAQEVLLPSN